MPSRWSLPSLVPLAQAVIAVLAVRTITGGEQHVVWQALLEAVLFVAVYGASLWQRERALIGELLTALR